MGLWPTRDVICIHYNSDFLDLFLKLTTGGVPSVQTFTSGRLNVRRFSYIVITQFKVKGSYWTLYKNEVVRKDFITVTDGVLHLRKVETYKDVVTHL